ncbi:MAG TPA: MlaD family protein [Gammaproteobacteria bacterium]|nr:MlaD family protein [Gammaproteobacteria bacterium]
MNNRAYALMTGIFVLLLAATIVFAGVWMGGSHTQTRPYIVVTTGNVAGLQPQSIVYFRGIAAGSVNQIQIDPANALNILIYVDINQDIPITRATYATLKLQGITGLSQLALDNSPGPLAMQPLATNRQSPARIPMQPSLFDKLGDSGVQLAGQLDKLVASLNELVNTSNRDHIQRLLAQADASSAMLLKLEKELDATARQLPALDMHAEEMLTKVKRAADNVSVLSHNLDRLTATATTNTVPRVNAVLGQISQAAADMHRLADSLRHDPQQLLLGPARPLPGPGEPGYKEPRK